MKPGFPLWLLLAAALAGTASSRQAEPAGQAALQPHPLEFVGEWGTKGDGPGKFSSPVRMAVDKAGNIHTAEAGSG